MKSPLSSGHFLVSGCHGGSLRAYAMAVVSQLEKKYVDGLESFLDVTPLQFSTNCSLHLYSWKGTE